MPTSFESAWQILELLPRPSRARKLLVRDWDGFRERVERGDEAFAKSVCASLYAGDCYILQGAFPRSFMTALRRKALAFFAAEASSFHQMRGQPPDFHKIITEEEGRKYAFPLVKHAAYYFPWNHDPIWEPVWDRWRVIKQLTGLAPDAYEKNLPADGIVDRIQIAHYPPTIGYLAPHADPYKYQRLFLSAYMSKRGHDYAGGGFYVVDAVNQLRFAEDEIEVGDIGIGYATVTHGVAACEGEAEWESGAGRWFLGLYSNASDEVKDRHTGQAVKL